MALNTLDTMFRIILDAKWLAKEQFRAGLTTLMSEATDQTQLDVINHVLRTLEFCTSADLSKAGEEAALQIEEGWGLDPSDTLIVGVAERGKTCGSTAILRCIETSLSRGWSSAIWVNIDSAFRKRDGKNNLVLVDDFVGTGEKLDGLIGRLRSNPKTADYVIYVCTFAAMEAGFEVVGTAVEGQLFSHRVLQRSISDLVSEPRRTEFRKAMENLELKIFSHPGKYSFGYKQSEAAFFLEAFNIPNNNFPILWWDEYANSAARQTLFRRR